MNIFTQYGIQQVTDVTLYGIAYDRYDNEVYIPILYFDTLKVSNVEQTADSVSARGGLGNAEQVIWDYNKELSISIQDALYTPASQSLLWGGLYSLKPLKLKGMWIKAEYDIDSYGNPIYYREDIRTSRPSDDSNYVKIICPCDNQEKWIGYVSQSITPSIIEGTPLTYNNKQIQFEDFSSGNTIDVYTYDSLAAAGAKEAKITIDNFSDFGIDIYDFTKTGGAQGKDFIVSYKATNPSLAQMTQTQQNVVEYRWTTCLASLVSEFDLDQVITDKITLYIQSFNDNDNKRVLFQNTYVNADNKYSYLHFYATIVKKLKGYDNNNQPIEKNISMKIYLGTFYLVEDWVMENGTAYSGINYIDSGIKPIRQFESTTKHTACRQFAIDINKNIQAYNVLKSPKYVRNNIECYLDPDTLYPYAANAHSYIKANGEEIIGDFKVFQPDEDYLKFCRRYKEDNSIGQEITINAKTFPTLFKVVGETKIRDRYGEDRYCQIEIPKCKLMSNISLNLSNSDPTTVDMNFKALQDITGTLAKIKLYDVETYKERMNRPLLQEMGGDITIPDTLNSTTSTKMGKPALPNVNGEIVSRDVEQPTTSIKMETPTLPKLAGDITIHEMPTETTAPVQMSRPTLPELAGDIKIQEVPRVKTETIMPRPTLPVELREVKKYSIRIIKPVADEVYCVGADCRIKDYSESSPYTYLRLPVSQEEAYAAAIDWDNHREILVVGIYNEGAFERYLVANDSQTITITR